MPPPLAALLCTGFILWLIRHDSRNAGPISRGLWIPLIWVSIISSRPVGYWFASGSIAAAAGDGMGGSFIDRNTYLFLILCGALVLARRRIDWSHLLRQSRVLWIYYAYLLLSTVWSDYPFVAFKRWFKEFGNLVMILIILTEPNPLAAMRAVFVRCAYVLIPVSVLFIKYYPELGRYTHRWTYETIYSGVTTNKNSLGVTAMVGGLFLLWQIVEIYKSREVGAKLGRLLRQAWPELLVFLMCLWLLDKAKSATALSSFVFSAIILLGSHLSWFHARLRHLGWPGFAVGILLLIFTVSPAFRTMVADVLGRDATLTGRTLIWEECLKLKFNPLIGCGFSSAWLTPQGVALVDELGGSVTHAHNGYLETYLHTGWLGVCLLFAVLLTAGHRTTRLLSDNPVMGRLFMAFFLGGIIYNYTEVGFNACNVIGFGLWFMVGQDAGHLSQSKTLFTDADPGNHCDVADFIAECENPASDCGVVPIMLSRSRD